MKNYKYGYKVCTTKRKLHAVTNSYWLAKFVKQHSNQSLYILPTKKKEYKRLWKECPILNGKLIFTFQNFETYGELHMNNVVRLIFERYASGVFVKDIISELNEKGIYNRGKPFARNTIYNLLKNEKYAGIFRHGDEIFKTIYPQIVPDDIYNIVRHKIDENHYGKHDSTETYLLKNKIKCGYCGKSVASDAGTSKNGTIKRYYKCMGRKNGSHCHKSPIRKELLEQLVIDTTFKIFENKATLDLIVDNVMQRNLMRIKNQSTLNLLIKDKENIQKSINNLMNCMEQGIITSSTKQRLEELDANLNLIEEKIAIEKARTKTELSRNDMIKFIKTSLKQSPQLMIKLLIKEIEIYEDKVEIYYNYIANKKRPDDENHQAFSFYNDSYEVIIDERKFAQIPHKIILEISAYI